MITIYIFLTSYKEHITFMLHGGSLIMELNKDQYFQRQVSKHISV